MSVIDQSSESRVQIGEDPDRALSFVKSRLDLSNIRMKLADSEEGPGYSESHLDLLETEYQRFLALKLAYPGEEVVPCKLVDEVWHRHILDTAAYREDCETLFGGFVDHFPYFGMRGPDDARDLQDAYESTIARYREAFGEPPAETWISDNPTRCRTACKPVKCR